MTIEIHDIGASELAPYCSLTERELRAGGTGLFIAESPKVIKVAIEQGYRPESMLCERRHITGDAADIISAFPEMPVYTADREVLAQLTGYKLTRGVLCAMRRRPLPSVEEICKDARLICVLQSVTDTTNIGSIFRSASALGVDAVVLSDDTCDPLNRRAVRVSMGTVFTVPWTMTHDPVNKLRKCGIKTAALALSDRAIPLDSPSLAEEPRLAAVFGTEGDGLPHEVIDECDYLVTIPMHHGVDSLNVGAAAAVTFWELSRRNRAMSGKKL